MTLKFDDSNETIDIDSIENSGSLSMVAPQNPEFTVGEMRLRGKTLTTGGTYVLGGMTKGMLWSEAVENGTFLKCLQKLKEVLNVWDAPLA